MANQLYHVDAFTREPFKGNPAAVCILDEHADEGWMQFIAAEMNLSDTAFLVPRDADFDLRWFTPEAEVPLCGHATLAAAHVLYESGALAPRAIATFHTKSGVLTARRDDSRIVLDFPVLDVQPTDAPRALLDALNASPVQVAATSKESGEVRYVLELASESQVLSLAPDFAALRSLPASVIVTARSDSSDRDFVSRYFAAHWGVNEDPVTGSAHCALLPYWAAKLGRNELVGYQASRRGGYVHCTMLNDRALLAGDAVTIASGSLATSIVNGR